MQPDEIKMINRETFKTNQRVQMFNEINDQRFKNEHSGIHKKSHRHRRTQFRKIT